MPVLDLRRKIEHIDQMLMDNIRKQQQQELAYASPWVAVIAGMGSGAAIFAAGMVLGIKLFGP